MTTPFTSSPSTITSVDSNLVKRIRVFVYGVSSLQSQDIQLLLTHNDKSCLLLSGQGGTDPCSSIDLVFDDYANSFLTNQVLVSGTYKPTSDFVSIIGYPLVPTPDVSQPYGYALSNFNGESALGDWDLWLSVNQYINNPSASVSVTSWEIQILTEAVQSISVSSTTTTTGNPFSVDNFVPQKAGELKMWFDANDSSTIFQDFSGLHPISKFNTQYAVLWKDKSGNGLDARAFDNSLNIQYQTNNKFNYLSFATNSYEGRIVPGGLMTEPTTLSSSSTMFFVVSIEQTYSYYDGVYDRGLKALVQDTNLDSLVIATDCTNEYFTFSNMAPCTEFNSQPVPQGFWTGCMNLNFPVYSKFRIICVKYDGNQSLIYVNGEEITSLWHFPGPITLNGSLYLMNGPQQVVYNNNTNYMTQWSGSLAEVLIYNGIITEESRNQITQYLSTKYSIPIQKTYEPNLYYYLPIQKEEIPISLVTSTSTSTTTTAAPKTVKDITGIQLWLDGSDEYTLFTDFAGTSNVNSYQKIIRRVNDKSGKGNNCYPTQQNNVTLDTDQTFPGDNFCPVYNINSLNGLSTIAFNNNATFLEGGGIHLYDKFSVWMVVQIKSTSSPFSLGNAYNICRLFTVDNPNDQSSQVNGITNNPYITSLGTYQQQLFATTQFNPSDMEGTSTITSDNDFIPDQGFYLLNFQVDGPNTVISNQYKEFLLESTNAGNYNSNCYWNIGGGLLNGINTEGVNGYSWQLQNSAFSGFEGSLAEIVVFDRILGPEDQQFITVYLSNKWLGTSLTSTTTTTTTTVAPVYTSTSTTTTFSPSDISGLVTWFDFADRNTLFQDSVGIIKATQQYNPIFYVADKSGYDRHYFSSVDSGVPPCLYLNGPNRNSCLYLPNKSETETYMLSSTYFLDLEPSYTIIAVTSDTLPSSQHTVLNYSFFNTYYNQNSYSVTNPSSIYISFDFGYYITENGIIGAQNAYILSSFNYEYSGTTNYYGASQFSNSFCISPYVLTTSPIPEYVDIYLNNSALTNNYESPSVNLFGNICLGLYPLTSIGSQSRYFCEFLVYNKQLSSLERSKIDSYLDSKWKLGTYLFTVFVSTNHVSTNDLLTAPKFKFIPNAYFTWNFFINELGINGSSNKFIITADPPKSNSNAPNEWSYGYRGYCGHLRSVGCNIGKYPSPTSGDYGLQSFKCYTYINIPTINQPNLVFSLYNGMISCMAAWFVRNSQIDNTIRQLIFGNTYLGVYCDNNGFAYVRTGNTYTQISDSPVLINNQGYVPVTLCWFNMNTANGYVYCQVGNFYKQILIENASFGAGFITDPTANDIYLFANPSDSSIPYTLYSTFNGSIDNFIYCSEVNFNSNFNGINAWFVKRGYQALGSSSFYGVDDFIPVYELHQLLNGHIMTNYASESSWTLAVPSTCY
jgi:hypothetical protein